MKNNEYERQLELIRELIRLMGDNPERPGLEDTPDRVLRSYKELFAGYNQDPAQILSTRFELSDCHTDEMIVSRNIEFHSMCEHHLLPFYGTAHVAYLPSDGQVVGISKLARLVDCFARRLQIQERMTSQIADAIQDCLKPKGVAVVVEAQHLCMCSRGANKHSSKMVSSVMLGSFRENSRTRNEFLQLIKA